MNRSLRAFLFPYRNSGSILVISLWILVFFSILSVGLYKVVSAQVSLVKRVEERVLCEYLAKAAVLYAQDERANNRVSFYDSLYGLAQEQERELGIGEFVYTMTDEESKININSSSEEVIMRLPGIDLDLAQRIISSPLKPFHVKEELLLVEECDKSFGQFKDFISVYSNGKVNVNTAPVEVLTALGIDSQVASSIEEFRKGPDLEEATEDDEVFENTGEIVDKLNSFRSLLTEQQEALLAIIGQGTVTVDSNSFTMHIEAKILNKPAMRYIVVMDENSIKQWQEW